MAFFCVVQTDSAVRKMYKDIVYTIGPMIAFISTVLIFLTAFLVLMLDHVSGLDKFLIGNG